MTTINKSANIKMGTQTARWRQAVVTLSFLLFFFSIPHLLEDFAYGGPAEAGISGTTLSLVAATAVFVQALGLYWMGQGQRRGIWAHLAVALFWPLGAGVAQLPDILDGAAYRAGLISVVFVAGMIAVGIALLAAAVGTLRRSEA